MSLVATAGLAVWALMRPAAGRARPADGRAACWRNAGLRGNGPTRVSPSRRRHAHRVHQRRDRPRTTLCARAGPARIPAAGGTRLAASRHSCRRTGIGSGFSTKRNLEESNGERRAGRDDLRRGREPGGPRGASWGPDDTIVFATSDPAKGLLRVSAGGGEAEVLTTPDAQKGELDHYWPEVLPGGRAVLFTIVPTTGGIA